VLLTHWFVWYAVEPTSWQEFHSSPTLLRFVGHLGLDAAVGMELFCIIGIVLSFAAFVSKQCRNIVFFVAMWMMYLSVFHVRLFCFLYMWYKCWHVAVFQSAELFDRNV